MSHHVQEVEEAILKVRQIHEAILELASIEDKALCHLFGLRVDDSSSDESCDDITTDDVEPDSRLRLVTEELRDMLCHNECGYNWFEFFDNLPSQTQEEFSSLPTQLVLDTFTKCGFMMWASYHSLI